MGGSSKQPIRMTSAARADLLQELADLRRRSDPPQARIAELADAISRADVDDNDPTPPVSLDWPAQLALFRELRLLRDDPANAARVADIRNDLAAANIGLVGFLCKRFNAHSDDAYSDGIRALVYCLNNFDPEKGFRFSTYAGRAIIAAVTEAEQQAAKHASRYRTARRSDDESDWRDPIIDRRRDDRESRLLADLLELLDGDGLTEQERTIVRRTMLDGRTLADVGRELGTSRDRTRHLRDSAFRKLRRALTAG